MSAQVAKNARELLLKEYRGALATQSKAMPGFPFGSVVPYCLDDQGRPVAYNVGTGVSDGMHTELLVRPGSPAAEALTEGVQVITGMTAPAAAASGTPSARRPARTTSRLLALKRPSSDERTGCAWLPACSMKRMPLPSSCTSSARTVAPTAPREEKPMMRTRPPMASNSSRPLAK